MPDPTKPSPTNPLSTKGPTAAKIDALSFPRFVVALAIVFKHKYRGPYDNHAAWAQLGVNFFFVLHGYVVTISKLSRKWPPDDEIKLLPNPRTLFRRFSANYPVYFLGIMASVFIVTVIKGAPVAGWQLFSELTMTSSFFMRYFRPEQPFWYNLPLWFVGVLAWFWLGEQASFSLVSYVWRSRFPVTFMCVVFILWNMLFLMPPFNGIYIHLGNVTPFRHFNQYWAGIMLAFVARDRRDRGVEPTKWMASATCLFFFGLLFIDPADAAVWMYNDFTVNGWLTPVQCMLILGLSEGADPLVSVCTLPGLSQLGDLAYAFYAMQHPVGFFKEIPALGHLSRTVRFFLELPILLSVAYVTFHYYQMPVQRYLDSWGKSLPI
mmetsp:Transcript_5627/g.13220  ORF Transcript_5627/g.13220 Transcript_5627/m.13220 type:complete len:378 (+) Transcript_5627:20-1153(+)